MSSVAFRIKDKNNNIVDEGVTDVRNIGYITMSLASNNYTIILKRIPTEKDAA